jgi:hypothetical protein
MVQHIRIGSRRHSVAMCTYSLRPYLHGLSPVSSGNLLLINFFRTKLKQFGAQYTSGFLTTNENSTYRMSQVAVRSLSDRTGLTQLGVATACNRERP